MCVNDERQRWDGRSPGKENSESPRKAHHQPADLKVQTRYAGSDRPRNACPVVGFKQLADLGQSNLATWEAGPESPLRTNPF